MVRAIDAKGNKMTEKQKHTTGPWKPCRSHEMFDGPMYDIEPDEAADYDAKPYVRIVAAGDEYVAAAHDLFEFNPANAHLIAAAPDLLAALRECELQLREYVEYHHRTQGGCSVDIESAWESARAAIAKAEGSVNE